MRKYPGQVSDATLKKNGDRSEFTGNRTLIFCNLQTCKQTYYAEYSVGYQDLPVYSSNSVSHAPLDRGMVHCLTDPAERETICWTIKVCCYQYLSSKIGTDRRYWLLVTVLIATDRVARMVNPESGKPGLTMIDEPAGEFLKGSKIDLHADSFWGGCIYCCIAVNWAEHLARCGFICFVALPLVPAR